MAADGSTGADPSEDRATTGNSTGSAGIEDAEVGVLVSEWESLQEGIRTHKRQYYRRVFRGIVVLAVVAGYALETGTDWLYLFVPVILVVLFALHLQEADNVYYHQWQSYRIESELEVDAFDWTMRFAGLTRPNLQFPQERALTRFDVSRRSVTAGAIYGIGAVVAVLFAIYSIWIVPELVEESERIEELPMLHDGADNGYRIGLTTLYGALFAAVGMAGVTHWRRRAEFDEWRVEQLTKTLAKAIEGDDRSVVGEICSQNDDEDDCRSADGWTAAREQLLDGPESGVSVDSFTPGDPAKVTLCRDEDDVRVHDCGGAREPNGDGGDGGDETDEPVEVLMWTEHDEIVRVCFYGSDGGSSE